MARDWSRGMQRIGPGVYADGKGGMHIDAEEICRAEGIPPTPQNIATIEQAAKDLAQQHGVAATDVYHDKP